VVGQQLLDELGGALVKPPFDLPLELLGAFLGDLVAGHGEQPQILPRRRILTHAAEMSSIRVPRLA
jgi:hypothetical protein